MSKAKKEESQVPVNGDNRITEEINKLEARPVKRSRADHVMISRPVVREILVPIRGFPGIPLVTQKMSQKVLEYIRGKQGGKVQGPRPRKDPTDNYQNAMHLMPGAKATDTNPDLGFPASGFRRAMIAAANIKVNGVSKPMAGGNIFVIPDGGSLVRIRYENLSMREDALKNESGVMDLRYRPQLLGWSALVRIQFDEGIVSPEQVVNLMCRAGFSVGIGESSPRSQGDWGRWEVVDSPEAVKV